MKSWKQVVTSLIGSAIALSGCGGQAYQNMASTPTSNTATPTPTVTVTSTPTANLPPPLQFTATFTGNTGATPTWTSPGISTDVTLQVLITPGPAGPLSESGDPTVSSSDFTGEYNCIEYQINVNGDETETQMMALDPNTPCYNNEGLPYSYVGETIPSYQYIDFSAELQPGHGAVTISVMGTGTQTDMYCQWLADNIDNPYSTAFDEYSWVSLFCPVKTLYHDDVATANIQVGVDGTLTPNPQASGQPAVN